MNEMSLDYISKLEEKIDLQDQISALKTLANSYKKDIDAALEYIKWKSCYSDDTGHCISSLNSAELDHVISILKGSNHE